MLTWVSVDSGSWWWTGRPGVLRFMGSQRVGHDWATDLIWSDASSCNRRYNTDNFISFYSILVGNTFPPTIKPITWLEQQWSKKHQFLLNSLDSQPIPSIHSTPGLPAHHQLLELTQTHVHQVSDAIQPFHPLVSPSTPAPNPPSIRVFSNESTLRMRWPKYWSFSFSIIPSKEIPPIKLPKRF